MATGEALFDLIKTLSPSEKGSFTRNNNLPKKNEKDDKNTYYKEVFDVLEALGAYDKEEILVRLNEKVNKEEREEMTRKKLQDAETYLYKKLIATLKNSYTKNFIEIQLYDLILEAQILYQKGLYELAIKAYIKAEKKALDYHKRALLLEIIPKKADAIVALQKKNILTQIDVTYQTAHDAIAILKEEMVYRHDNIKLTAIFRTKNNKEKTNPLVRKEVATIYQKTAEIDYPQSDSFFAKYYYYNILALSSYLLKNYTAAIEYQQVAIEVWEQHPVIQKKNLSAYMTQLANQINYFICAKQYNEAETIIDKLSNLSTSNVDEKGEQFQNVYFYKQMLYLNQRNYAANKALLKDIEKGLEQYQGKINISRELAFLYNTGLAFWMEGAFDKAQAWLRKIPKSNRFNEHRPDIVRDVHLLQLAIFYELNSKEVVEEISNKLRAISRGKQQEITPFEEILITFFKRLNSCVDSSKEKRTIFLDFQTALQELKGQTIMGYEAYCNWVDRQLTSTTTLR